MNWIKSNKFLFGWIVVVVIGVGVLGYFVSAAMGRYDDARADYTQKASDLNRLQRLPLYPNQANLEKLADQKKQMSEEVEKVVANVAAQQFPLEEITPVVFQDRLKATTTALKAKAEKNSPAVVLPQKFFLGFDEYESRPPDAAAAPALARELKAIEWLVGLLIDEKVLEIRTIDRAKLPQELPKAPEKKPRADQPGRPADKEGPGAKGTRHTVGKYPITLVFQSDQVRLKEFLNTVVSFKGQFFIPRLVTVRNEKEKGPSKVPPGGPAGNAGAPPSPDPSAPPGSSGVLGNPAAAAAPQAPPPPPLTTFIVGEERIEASVIIEMVEFAETP